MEWVLTPKQQNKENLPKIVDSVIMMLSTIIFMKEGPKMEKFQYIAIVRTNSETNIYGFYSKRVLHTATSSWMNWGYAVEVMDMSVYKYSDRYEIFRQFKEVIDYKGGTR